MNSRWQTGGKQPHRAPADRRSSWHLTMLLRQAGASALGLVLVATALELRADSSDVTELLTPIRQWVCPNQSLGVLVDTDHAQR